MTYLNLAQQALTWTQEQPERAPCLNAWHDAYYASHGNSTCPECRGKSTVPNVLPPLVRDAVSVVQDMRSMDSPFPVPERVLRKIATMACPTCSGMGGDFFSCSTCGLASEPSTGHILDESDKWAYLGRFIPVARALESLDDDIGWRFAGRIFEMLGPSTSNAWHSVGPVLREAQRNAVDGVLTAVLEAVQALEANS